VIIRQSTGVDPRVVIKSTEDEMLPRILSPDSAALLVVDVQNDFCHPDGLFGRLGVDLTAIHIAAKRIANLLTAARKARVPIIFVMMTHDESTNSEAWTQRSPTPREDACLAGTWGAELFEVRPAPGEPIVVKHRYSPFVGTNIEYLLRAKGRRSLLVTGVTTNVCVEAVLRDGFMRDYHIVLIEDCAAAYTAEAHRTTVDNVRNFLGRVVDSDCVRAYWQGIASVMPSP
jgi:ureidoacrylate peracid hydrolase